MAARLLLGEEEEEQKHVLPFAPKSSSKLQPVAHFTAEEDPLFFFLLGARRKSFFPHHDCSRRSLPRALCVFYVPYPCVSPFIAYYYQDDDCI
jgi:hypothetical protein